MNKKVLVVSTTGGPIALYAALLGAGISQATGQIPIVAVPKSFKRQWGELPSHPVAPARMEYLDFDSRAGKAVSLLSLLRLAWVEKVDVVHDVGGSISRMSVPLWALLSLFAKVFITEHEPFPQTVQERPLDMMTRRVADRVADGIFVHGSASYQRLLERGCPLHKAHISRHGVFDVYGESLDAPSIGPPTVLVFGKMRPNKGIERLPDIVRQTRALLSDVRFCIAGSREIGGSVSRVRAWSQRLNVVIDDLRSLPQVTVEDRFIPEAEVRGLFSRATIVLLPYLSASESGVLAIAAGLGVPSVVTDVGDISETVRRNQLGLVVPGDADSIAAAIASIVQRPEMSAGFRRSAIQYARGEGNWTRVAETCIEAYQAA